MSTNTTHRPIGRRQLARGVAWAVPAVAVAASAPALAASAPCPAPTLYSGPSSGSAIIRGTTDGGGPDGYQNLGTAGDYGINRWWEWTNTIATADVPANYLTYTRTFEYTVAAGGAYTIMGDLQANFGSNCMTCSDAAGLLIQTSVDGSVWVSKGLFVTRAGMQGAASSATLPIKNPNGTNSTTTVGVGSATTLTWSQSFAAAAVTSGTYCDWAGFYNNGAYTTTPQTASGQNGLLFSDVAQYDYTVTATAAAKVFVRFVHFIQPRDGGCETGGAQPERSTNDDIGVSNPVVACVA